MAKVIEIAPDLYRISYMWPQINLEFSHFLLNDEEPLLFSTGFRGTFAEVRDAVAKVIDPARLRWISYSHFEPDECGALNQWLAVAPNAVPVASVVSTFVCLGDFSDRPAQPLVEATPLVTGKYRLRHIPTPHLPHGWDASVLFEETTKTLLCSDLFHQMGECEPLTESDVLGRVREAMLAMEVSPMPHYMPWTARTQPLIDKLAALEPRTLAIMHGSSFRGNCAQAIHDFGVVMKDVMDRGQESRAAA